MVAVLERYRINIGAKVLDDLAARLSAIRWTPGEMDGWSRGTSLTYLRHLLSYWRDRFDWRAQEAMLNRFAQYRGEVDGTVIHFVHERGHGASPMPLILTHGFPDSFFRFYKLIPLLTDPAAHGGDADDAFDVVV